MLLLLGISVWHSGWHDNYLYFTQVFGSMSCGTPGVASKSLPSLVESVFYRNTFASQMGANVPELPSWLCLLAKATSGLLLGGILLALWKARRAAQNLSYDLVLMALASLLAAPVAWRHYYVLAILPILYFWVCLERAKPPSLMLYRCVLAAATVVIGTGQLEELIFSTQGNVLHLALSATWIAAAAGILVVALCQYRRERIAA